MTRRRTLTLAAGAAGLAAVAALLLRVDASAPRSTPVGAPASTATPRSSAPRDHPSAPAPGPTIAPPQEVRTTQLTGTVTDRAGHPLAAALVSGDDDAVRTSSSGAFALRALPGPLQLTVAHAGHCAHRRAAAAPDHVVIALDAAGRVRGRVLAQGTGEPIPHLTIEVDGTAVTTSDAAGAFELTDVCAGYRRLSAHGAHWATEGIWLGVGAGSDSGTVVLSVSPALMIRARVHDADGEVCREGDARADLVGALQPQGSASRVGEDGRVELGGLRPGRYRVWARCGDADDAMDDVVLTGGDVDHLVWRVAHSHRLSGRVQTEDGRAVPHLALMAFDRRSRAHACRTDADGRFRFEALRPDEYRLVVDTGLDTSELAKVTVDRDVDLPLTMGVRGSVVAVVLDVDGAPLTGAQVSVIEVGEVRTLRTGRRPTDGEGRATFRGLAPGRYQLAAALPGAVGDVAETPVFALGPFETRSEVLRAREAPRRLNGVVVDDDGRPRGGVIVRARRADDPFFTVWENLAGPPSFTDAGGAFTIDVAHAAMVVLARDPTSGASASAQAPATATELRLTLGAVGRVCVDVVHAPTLARTYSMTLRNLQTDEMWRWAWYRDESPTCVPAAPYGDYLVEAVAGDELGEADLHLNAPEAIARVVVRGRVTLRGRVVRRSDARAVADVEVNLADSSGGGPNRTTDHDGRFTFEGVRPGVVTLTLWGQGTTIWRGAVDAPIEDVGVVTIDE